MSKFKKYKIIHYVLGAVIILSGIAVGVVIYLCFDEAINGDFSYIIALAIIVLGGYVIEKVIAMEKIIGLWKKGIIEPEKLVPYIKFGSTIIARWLRIMKKYDFLPEIETKEETLNDIFVDNKERFQDDASTEEIDLICPNCGARLVEKKGQCICMYCGKKYEIIDE